jgi:hypothetical protein
MEFRTIWKENQNALDYFCGSACFVGSRTGHVLHHGRFHTHLAGFGDHHILDPSDSGPKDDFLTEENNQMKSISLVGILLAVLGVFALVYQGFSYTRQEKVLDVGPIHATRDETTHVPLPPIFGGLALLGGAALLIMGAKQKA